MLVWECGSVEREAQCGGALLGVVVWWGEGDLVSSDSVRGDLVSSTCDSALCD